MRESVLVMVSEMLIVAEWSSEVVEGRSPAVEEGRLSATEEEAVGRRVWREEEAPVYVDGSKPAGQTVRRSCDALLARHSQRQVTGIPLTFTPSAMAAAGGCGVGTTAV